MRQYYHPFEEVLARVVWLLFLATLVFGVGFISFAIVWLVTIGN